MTQGLPVSRVVQTSVSLSVSAAQGFNFDTACIVGSTPGVINAKQRLRLYTGIAQVAADFGTSAPEYLASVDFFAQNPQPQSVYIGFWAQATTRGYLYGAVLTPTQQLLSNFTAVTSGGFTITANGNAAVSVTGINLSGAANLNAVAADITTALSSATVGVSCTWNAVYQQFILNTTGSLGSGKIILPLTAPGSGTDISGLIGCTAAAGAIEVDPVAAESAVTAMSVLDGLTTYFYSVMFASTSLQLTDMEALAVYIQADTIPHYYWASTSDPNAINPSSSADIGSLLLGQGFTRTGVVYSSTDPYAAASAMGEFATINWAGQNTTITLAFKTFPGVAPEILGATAAATLDAKRYVYYAQYANGAAVVNNGWSSGLAYCDEIYGTDVLANTVQTNIFVVLQTLPKVPQTDPGVNILVGAAESACTQFGTNPGNGLLAPGTWQSAGFGALNYGDYMPTGFYVYAPPVATQSAALRATRQAPVMQIAAKLAGAIQDVDVLINVNR